MAQKGLTKQMIVQTAAEQIERGGSKDFTMRALAEALGVKSASLYNHIESMEALVREVCRLYLQRQEIAAMQAVGDKRRCDAVRALAEAYYRYAKEHRELYALMLRTAQSDNALLDDAAQHLTDPLKAVMEGYAIREEDRVHFRRLLRAIVHGFVSEEDIGFFSHYPSSAEESFRFAVRQYIDLLREAEKEGAR